MGVSFFYTQDNRSFLFMYESLFYLKNPSLERIYGKQ
jgi:hypothetical protein